MDKKYIDYFLACVEKYINIEADENKTQNTNGSDIESSKKNANVR